MGDVKQRADAVWSRMIHQESGGKQTDRSGAPLTSSKGAIGRAQVMPGTARATAARLGIPFDEKRYKTDGAYNEYLGRSHFDWLVNRYNGNTTLASAAYNAGEGKVDEWVKSIGDPRRGQIRDSDFAARIPYKETRGYVANVADLTAAKSAFSMQDFEAGASGAIRVERQPFDQAQFERLHPQDQPEKSLSRFLSLATGQDWTTSALSRVAERNGAEYDPNYRLPAFGSPEWNALTKDVPEQFWDTFGNALSASHAQQLRQQLLDEMNAEQELSNYGGWGIAGRVAVNVVDPANIALAVGTGGYGLFVKGGRMIQVARAARIAGEFTEARNALNVARTAVKASAWRNAARVGAANAVENMALEAVVDSGSNTKDGWDVAFAGLTGFAMGGLTSRLFSGAEKRTLANAYLRERTTLQYAELDAALATRRARLLERAGDAGDLETAKGITTSLRQIDNEIAHMESVRSGTDMNRLNERIAEVETNIASLVSRGAGAEELPAIQKALSKVERELHGRRKETRALTQQIGSMRRKGAQVFPADQEAALRKQIGDRLRAEDVKVWGDKADSPKIARKRQKEINAEVQKRISELPGDPKVARLERKLADNAGATERLSAEKQRLSGSVRDTADLLAAQREKDALLFMQRDPAAADARLADLHGQRRRLVEEQARLGDAGRAAQELQQLDELVPRIRRLIDLASDHIDPPAVDIKGVYGFGGDFGSDTLSAARFEGEFRGISDELREAAPKASKEVGQTAFAKIQAKIGTLGGILRGHDNALVRSKVGVYVGDSVGTKSGTVSHIGASEVSNRLNEAMLARFNSVVDPLFDKWRKDAGKGFFRSWTRTTRAEFMEAVGKAIKGADIEDPAVKAAAAKIRGLFGDFLKEARDAGVKGFDEVAEKANYLPRMPLFDNIFRLEQRIGTGNVEDFFKRAIVAELKDTMPEADLDNLAGKIAKGYLLRMKKLRVGADAQMMSGVPLGDFAYLRHIMEQAGEQSDEIDSILGKLAAFQQDRGKSGGKVRHARGRVQFDENFELRYKDMKAPVVDNEYQYVTVKMSDLFENNVEQLFHRYSRTMSGHIGMAKAAGVTSIADHQKNLEDIKRALEDRPSDEIARVVRAADVAYKLVVGHPVEEAGVLNDVLRFARDYNFATTMNQAGFAQIPDVAGLISKGYLRHTLRHSGISDLVRMMKRGPDGRLDDALSREVEEWVGLGTDYHNNAVFASYSEDIEQGFVRGAAGKLNHAVRLAGRGTQVVSGMAFINSAAQRLAGKAIVQRLVKESLEGGQISEKRLAQLGIDTAMKERIGQQIKKHTGFVQNDVGGKVRVVNWAGWDDLEARDAMLYGVFREARRLVQEEDLADTAEWMHKGIGKVILQFRRFALVNFTRQVLHGVNMRDAEAGSHVMMSMGLAALSYVAQMQVKAGAMDQRKREEFEAKYLSPSSIAAASFSRSSFSSMFPAVIDTTLAFTTDTRLFDQRSSGLGSDLITGNPTYALGKNAAQAFGAPLQALARDDRQLTQDDAKALRRIIPFQNTPGMDYLVNPYIDALPKSDQDSDQGTVDWTW